MADDKIGSIKEEREKLQQLETPFRDAVMKDPHSAAALQARQTLQAEVDKINNSKALSDPSVRQDYVGRLTGLLEADDYSGIAPPDNNAKANRVHLPTVKEDKPGHLVIVPDATVRADEDRVKANMKLGMHPYLDASETTHYLHTHGKSDQVITDYDKKVFGLPTTTIAASAHQYESEFNSLRRASFNLYAARAGLKGYDLATASSQMSALLTKLNNEGPDHVNHLARGMNHIYTQCLENKNGKLSLKPAADLAIWQKALANSGNTEYDLKGR